MVEEFSINIKPNIIVFWPKRAEFLRRDSIILELVHTTKFFENAIEKGEFKEFHKVNLENLEMEEHCFKEQETVIKSDPHKKTDL